MNFKFIRHTFFSFAASGLNYLFLLLCAKKLGPDAFSLFNQKWANLSFFLFLGTLSHFIVCMNVFSYQKENKARNTLLVTGLMFIGLYYLTDLTLLFYLSILFVSISQSIMFGSLIKRGLTDQLGLIFLLSSLVKCSVFFFLDITHEEPVFLALLVSSSLATLLGIFFFKTDESKSIEDGQVLVSSLLGALILAVYTNFFPVHDVIWGNLFFSQARPEFISALSVVTRVVFFVQLIIVQWGFSDSTFTFEKKKIFYPSMFFVSVLLSFGSYLFLESFLGWKGLPSIWFYLISSVSAGLMALHFSLITSLVRLGRMKETLILVILFLVFWIFTGIASIEFSTFMKINLLAHFLCCVVAIYFKFYKVKNEEYK